MTEIEPHHSFREAGTRAKARVAQARTRRRLMILAAAAAGVAGLAAVTAVALWLWPGQSSDPVPAEGDFGLTQIETFEEPDATDFALDAFQNLRKDPMILSLPQSQDAERTSVEGPPDLPATRFGVPGPDRFVLIEEALRQSDLRLVTRMPSSRAELALFQAQRRGGLMTVDQEEAPIEEESEAEVMVPTSDAGTEAPYEPPPATFSVALTLRQDARRPLYEDTISVLADERTLEEFLRANEIPDDRAALVARGAERTLGIAGALPARSVIAFRRQHGLQGAMIRHLAVYTPDGGSQVMAQSGLGRFARSENPWAGQDLMQRTGSLRAEADQNQDLRLIDALYSAAIRNGMDPALVGEMIAMVAQQYELDEDVGEADRVTILYAPDAPGGGPGALAYVGLETKVGLQACYVTPNDDGTGFRCFPFGATVRLGAAGPITLPPGAQPGSTFRDQHEVGQVTPEAMAALARFEAATGQTFTINDSFRNPATAGSNSARNSQHYRGNAFDIDVRHLSPPERAQLIVAARLAGFGGIGVGTNILHVDIGAQRHWGYHPSGRAGAPVPGWATGPLGTQRVTDFSGGGGQVVVAAAPESDQGSGAVEALVNQIIQVESAGNATARNSRSTATGLGQFIDSTWLRMMRTYRPDLVQTMSRQQVLDLRYDPIISRAMVRELARENEAYLRARGHAITPGRLYLAHFLGQGGAHQALRSDRNASVGEVFGAGVVNANPFLRGRSIGYLQDWADRKMTGASATTAATFRVRPITVPPEVEAYREAIDEMLEKV